MMDETRSRIYSALSCAEEIRLEYGTTMFPALYHRLILPVSNGYFRSVQVDMIDHEAFKYLHRSKDGLG
jgi:hypothetical protein